MGSLRQYALSIIVTSLICGILSGMTEKCSGKSLIRYLCGLVLAASIILPLTNTDSFSMTESILSIQENGNLMAGQGTQMAQAAKAEIIKQKIEAYILDKATLICEDVSVNVTLNDDQFPDEIVLAGTFSPNDKHQLQKILLADLGITEEKLLWTS